MARSVLQIKGYTAEEIHQLFKRDERYTIGIRLYAVHQVALGKPSRQLEELYNTSFKQITNWVHRFEAEGIDGLRDKPGRGRTSRLSTEQEAELRELVMSKSPEDYQYNTATWTGPIIIDWIRKHFAIEYKKVQVYNILKKLGFTYQKGRGIYPEANEQKREEFKESLKKTPFGEH
jgi:transposase